MIGQENRIILKMPHIVAVTLFVLIAFMVGGVVNADTMVEKSIIDRIKPFGEVNVGSAPVAAAPAAVDAKGSYMASCAACHATGAAGSPKVGDKAAWKKRIAQGMDTLDEHAINGFKGMPPRGGSSLSDDAVKAAVKYMVKNSK